jgi:hypothetical protein
MRREFAQIVQDATRPRQLGRGDADGEAQPHP